jgi:hypothetical protein
MLSRRKLFYVPMVLKGVAIVYSLSFVASLVLVYANITPQSNPNVYPLLALLTEAVGVAIALRVAQTTRVRYLFAIGIGLWLVNGISVLLGAQSAMNWLESSVFVALTILLGRLLVGTVRMTPTLDLSLKGIIYDRNSGLLGHRAGRSIF